jgi:uncharacterized protein YjeT (DUF2065 family)
MSVGLSQYLCYNKQKKEVDMLANIIGWIFVILGILFIVKPEILRNKLQKKGIKKLKKYLFYLALIISLGLLVASFKMSGIGAKIIAILGIIGIFKAIFLLKAKAADKMLEWSAKQPLNLFRFGGAIYIIIGIAILRFS